MIRTINCEIDRAEGSLQRLIGLVERRGFHIDVLEMEAEGNGGRRVALGVRARDSGRCFDVLGRQIDRLIGVRRIAAGREMAV
ncbi:MAG: ACT domain-containing protein [Caulobacteraceae bacterium]|nr:ACT domain-containing protein [Caulobacteraceae bacterium]